MNLNPFKKQETVEVVSIRHVRTYANDDYEVVAKIDGVEKLFDCGGDFTTCAGKGIAWFEGNPPMSGYVQQELDKAFCKWKGWIK